MKAVIYYFSATGNCLAAARQIAACISAETVSIATLDQGSCDLKEYDRIGIVFPSYLAPIMGMPLIVERFVNRLSGIEHAQIFTVCTCGGYEFANALLPLERMSDLLRNRGGTVFAQYSVRMPMSNLDYKHIPVPISSNVSLIIERAEKKIDRICEQIQHNKRTRFPLSKWFARQFVGLIYQLLRKPAMKTLIAKSGKNASEGKAAGYFLPYTDRSILVRDTCIGCGVCEKVCPARNIILVNQRPQFQHRCEMCFACDEWCPSGAIQHWSREDGIKYHHPAIHLKDIQNIPTSREELS